MVERKSQKGKQEEAQCSLRCHKSGGNRLKELTASKHSSSPTILSNQHTQSLRGYFIHTNRREASQDVFKHQRNRYLQHSPQAYQVGHPTERRYYFKAPEWLGCSEAMRDAWTCFSSSGLLRPAHSFLCSGNHCLRFIPTPVTLEDRSRGGSRVNEDFGGPPCYVIC